MNDVLQSLKEEVDQTLLFFVNYDLNTYGFVRPETKHLFKVQNRKYPQILEDITRQYATIQLENVTGDKDNEILLNEIKKDTALTKGAIIENTVFNPKNKCCQFSVNEINVTAWVGHTCKIIEFTNPKE